MTQAPQAWDLTTGSAQVVIADIDSGVASSHPDLASQLVPGHNVLNGSADTTDTYGHGTYVAGVIAAATNNGIGVAGYCWACRLMPVKVYSSGGAYVSDIAAGMTWAVDHGARVLNLSLAGSTTSSTLANAVSYARQHGAVVVAAAGNNSCDCPKYPAAIPGVVGVAASDQLDSLYSYSNYGSWVDVAAPGQNLTTWPSGGYGAVGGTSMAAPVVAGIAGLLFSANLSATPDAVEQALFSSAEPLNSANGVAYGRVNAYRALLAFSGGEPPPANAVLPVISGTPQTGQNLTASTGTWSGSPTSYAYQWLRCDSSGACTPVAGGNGQSYLLASADVGSALRVTVTATNVGAGSATSAATSTVTAAGQTLTFSGSLNPANPSRSYAVTVGAGAAHAVLAFSKCASLSLTLRSFDGTPVATTNGASTLTLDATLAAGSYSYQVSGGRCSFTLTVTSPTP